MNILKSLLCIVIGISVGVVISGGLFAFISTIGIVPRMAQKTKTTKRISLYEDLITLGGIVGCIFTFVTYEFLLSGVFINVLIVLASMFWGIFIGSVAVSIAETLDVFPIFMRRIRLAKGVKILITAVALGKIVGCLMYYLIDGFFK